MKTGWDTVLVLVVDDNKNMRTLVGSILQGFGISSVREAANGADALEILYRWSVDLVICDYMMDGMNGVELVRRIRTAPDSPNRFVPIIMLSGHSQQERVMEARDAGANEFLAKPVTAAALADRVNRVLQRPRPFIRSPRYTGPDRRRRADPNYPGPFRRDSDPPAEAGGA